MANIRNANTVFLDTASTLSDIEKRNIKVSNIVLTSIGGGTARLVLDDKTTGATKIDLRIPTGDESQSYPFEKPMVFPNGIIPATVDFCVATLVVEETRR